MSHAANLLYLPVSVSALIFAQLDPQDILHLRQTCSVVHAKTITIFARRFFTARRITSDHESLQKLEKISKHPRLGQYIQTLEIVIDHASLFNQYMANAHAVKKALDNSDSEVLVRTECGTECLSRALLNLTNCRRIGIRSAYRIQGAGQHISTKRGPKTTQILANEAKLAYRVIQAVLTAVAISQLQIEILDIRIGSSAEIKSCITPDLLIGPSVAIIAKSRLISLRRLHLVLNPNNPKLATDSSAWVPSFLHFIGLLPDLSELALEFEGRDTRGRFAQLCTLMRIPKLRALTVGWTDCTSMELTFLLLRHRKTLREINFDSVGLMDDVEAWRWLVETIRDSLNIGFFSMTESLIRGQELIEPHGAGLLSQRLEASDTQGLCDIADFLSYRETTRWASCC
ncbi:hypothetical protein BFJ69_g2477 [Fusarium oxysporum]|uniref:F-box domain-containing protein n=1 Tax=Fusarium oxysporum TaxID=5507 RepID=A0A420NTY2_FUSOX|nr:hypothetical protein BFJ69_g2477 [Fusarium oxysporum]